LNALWPMCVVEGKILKRESKEIKPIYHLEIGLSGARIRSSFQRSLEPSLLLTILFGRGEVWVLCFGTIRISPPSKVGVKANLKPFSMAAPLGLSDLTQFCAIALEGGSHFL
jgi:hypothetical protein